MSHSEPARTVARRTRSDVGITVYGCGPDEAALFRRMAPRFGVTPTITEAAVGPAVVDRLRGFGCRILAHDTRPRTAADYVPLDHLLRDSDIVTLHTPLTADTHHLLDRARIERMKRGAYVINTGRGALLDTGAL